MADRTGLRECLRHAGTLVEPVPKIRSVFLLRRTPMTAVAAHAGMSNCGRTAAAVCANSNP